MSTLRSLVAISLAAVGLHALAAESELTIDRQRSRIEIAVNATVDSFVGTLDPYDLRVTLNNKGDITRARLEFRFRDILTGKPKRDEAMHAWQHTDQFPDGACTVSALERGDDGSVTAYGQLSFHGVTRDVRFPVAIAQGDGRYVMDGDVAIDTREFGLPVIRMFALLKVDPVVHVRFHVQAADEPAAQ